MIRRSCLMNGKFVIIMLYKLPLCGLEPTNACMKKINVKCDDRDTIRLEMHQTNLLPDV